MNRHKIIEGILENLEFDTLIDFNKDTYKVECKLSVNVIDIIIHNINNDSEFATAYCSVGKMKDKDSYMVKINCKKEFWYKEFDTLGVMVDSIEDITVFIKECCKTIIKGRDAQGDILRRMGRPAFHEAQSS